MFSSNNFVKYRFQIILFVVFFISAIILGITMMDISKSVSIVSTNTAISYPATIPPSSPTSLPSAFPTSTPKILQFAIWQPLPPILEENYILITNGSRFENKIALTFDACQTEGDLSGYDTEIVRVLNESNTPATFFLGGLWMRDHKKATLELAQNPLFELGNHSWSHLDFRELTPAEITEEIQKAQEQMHNLLGFQTTLFRLPFGTYTEDTLETIANNGLYTIQWDVVSGDPDPNTDAASMIEWVLYQVEPGSIIIMHVNERGWHTAEALPSIIETLRNQGYEFLTVSNLLGIEAKK